jgi:hypothetical protein
MSGPGYLITFAGEMDEALREQFEDLEIVPGRGVTQLRLRSGDRSMLHGVLHRMADLGLELLEVQPSNEEDS